jgi:hypothetical protein
MKIQIVKKATSNAKPQGFCIALVDDGAMNKR